VEELVVDALATYRLTRLVQREAFPPVKAVRDYLNDGLVKEGTAWDELLNNCPWCCSFWVGVTVRIVRASFPRAWRVVGYALAASAVSGLVAERE
jgi:hypothetical protein